MKRVHCSSVERDDLNALLQHPLQPKSFSHRYLAGAGISPLLQKQLEELSKRNVNSNSSNDDNKGSRFVIIGQDRVEPLQALQYSGQEICVIMDKQREKRRLAENWRRKKHEEKKIKLLSSFYCTQEQKKKDTRSAKERD
ncbi:DEAD-box ATP-dependent RNA helicase 13-like [Hordeum vulgare subsp. vulgare]|uniref:DEAD-box ATP-dependent RNA helicase 13-like n=1 Tax=Hordeum vulgare subsp. vulgare TaxID=112509 RepID=UPI000B4796B8|nr:DEAD-box ATP-dependent RNA helicase 13-like [Hordeum vulgare subsp. vulgare]